MRSIELMVPDWPAPAGVRAVVTTRAGGVSSAPYGSFNLALHTGDDPEAVRANRRLLADSIGATAIQWLTQVHGTAVHRVDAAAHDAPEADALWTERPDTACALLTADCLPVLLCDDAGTVVAAAHAGWRGLAAGVLASLVAALPVAPGRLLAWIGPGISAAHYEVGADVRDAVAARTPRDVLEAVFELRRRPGAAGTTDAAGTTNAAGTTDATGEKWLFDLAGLARRQLAALGLGRICGAETCTFTDRRFYSHRREGETGRFASVIWLAGG